MIDTNRGRLMRAEEMLDVRTLGGHGASSQILEIAGAAKAHLVAAVTNSDEVNLIATVAARQLGAMRTAAWVYTRPTTGAGRLSTAIFWGSI